jgi:hypothetical protein
MFKLKLKKGKAAPDPGKPSARASNPQGITARGNALYQIAGVALLVLPDTTDPSRISQL